MYLRTRYETFMPLSIFPNTTCLKQQFLCYSCNRGWRKYRPFRSDECLYLIKPMNSCFSNKDRQLVLKGMVDFGFVLLGTERKAGTETHLPWDYGCRILQKIGRKRHDAGGTILEILVDKIVRAGSNVIQYTGILMGPVLPYKLGDFVEVKDVARKKNVCFRAIKCCFSLVPTSKTSIR